jgi:hypothetical protein
MPLNYNTILPIKGSWVLCTDDYFTAQQRLILPRRPVRGEFYTIRQYLSNTDPLTGQSHPAILLNEISNPRMRVVYTKYTELVEPGFAIDRFLTVSGKEDIERAVEDFYNILNT